ncbi:diaminohydroxyphosphoribosylaminopyrimidine deaminase / 5-amino-6-(5-phosphoribosylamino)uracil reductase [Kytococcus aerolatus]|uniref:Riboflavin biosynthesis protein RibD n=2 Tax=Kytococcus aerolatus TaxID=592308 RepID=A0A212TFR6_9MICO|nr:diaminohydroxyphosphoribosylaminopyrimidine deaminase / 5-amino-6-(5-phosphoribosylamino)uracil reductase [Kytococcus aerolatus]
MSTTPATSIWETPMRRALELAARGPAVDPNPRVGCVLLDAAGHTLGEGFHRGAGTPHAEVAALADAARRAGGGEAALAEAGAHRLPAGTTAVVTLEPCNHTGRTGPCAEALLEAGVARVVIAQTDPTPLAAGGAERLRSAGVELLTGLLADEAEQLNPWFTQSARLGRPVVTLKLASTLDGRVAAADGTSQWITGPAARLDVHRQRATAGAIVVGTGTALADDPQLTVRLPEDDPARALLRVPAPAADDASGSATLRQPLRVVVGTRELPASARLRDDAAETLLLPTHDPAEVLATLAGRGIHHVWLEGGPTLAAAFLRAGLVDRLVHHLAPALLGAGAGMVSDLGIGTIAEIDRWQLQEVARLGDDLRLTLTPGPAGPHTPTPSGEDA